MAEISKNPAQALSGLIEAGQDALRKLTMPVPGGTELVSQLDPTRHIATATKSILELHQSYIQTMSSLWSETASVPAQETDKRFAGEAWRNDPRFEVLKRTYLAYADFLEKAVDAAPVDEKTRGQMRFAVRQFIDAMSPANFFATNPEAMQLALETGGQSLTEGIRLYFEDVAKGRISMSDESAFEVGRNLATTEGAVVFENDLMQLIQYAPSTATVYERPLLIVPPCINKFYILDLQPENSFVRYAVTEGHTVFLISWRDTGPELGHLTWDDYLRSGVMQAIDVALDVTSADKVNALGFCIGGVLLSSSIAVQKANDQDMVASVTLLTTMLDYSDTGELGLLIDEQTVAARDAAIGKGGLLHGKELATTFSSLRANDLIWPYVVNSYLKGKEPQAFDMLYWNSDSTNLPGPMFCWYIRNTYLENNLREPGKTIQCGVPVDLSSLDMPAYVYASHDDHIVPWRTAYETTQLVGPEVTFVLGASGHIAGVVNPPAKKKRNYWAQGELSANADQWLATAEKVPGSWWPNWSAWLEHPAGNKVAASGVLGNKRYRVIEPAPGRYVKATAD